MGNNDASGKADSSTVENCRAQKKALVCSSEMFANANSQGVGCIKDRHAP